MVAKGKQQREFLELAAVPGHPPLPLFHMCSLGRQSFVVITVQAMEWHIRTHGLNQADLSAREALQKGDPAAYRYEEGFKGIAQTAIPGNLSPPYTGMLVTRDGTPVAIGAINLGQEAFAGESIAPEAIIKNDQRPPDSHITSTSSRLETSYPSG